MCHERNGVLNHRPLYCLFRLTPNNSSQLRLTGPLSDETTGNPDKGPIKGNFLSIPSPATQKEVGATGFFLKYKNNQFTPQTRIVANLTWFIYHNAWYFTPNCLCYISLSDYNYPHPEYKTNSCWPTDALWCTQWNLSITTI